jgi:uncharacterized protein involved in exopolysaccharide biosynthesis
MTNISKSPVVTTSRMSPIPCPYLYHYLATSLLGTLVIGGIATAYLQLVPPRYRSSMTLNLPSTNSFTRVDVPGLGGASVQNSSPYSSAQDPRENYKIIAGSDQVLDMAALLMKKSIADMGKPTLKVVDGATVMQISFMGNNPEEAQAKTQAFHQALETRLDELRKESASQHEQTVQKAIGSSRKKLGLSQQQVASYRAQTGLNSEAQVQELAINIENLRRQRSELIAEQTKAASRFQSLQRNLSLNSQQATDILKLQADPVLQEAAKKYSQVTAELTNTESTYQPSHPMVLQERDNQRKLKALIQNRTQELLGRNLVQQGVNASISSPAREALMQDLVLSQVDTQGMEAKIASLDREIALLETRLTHLAQSQAKLDILKRNMQIAETVFSSKLTQLDAESSDASDAYPKMQLLAAANLPDEPVQPKRLLVLMGVGASILLLNTGALTLWAYHRKEWYKRHRLANQNRGDN